MRTAASRLRELPHRGMQRRGGPEDVAEEPAEIGKVSAPVRVLANAIDLVRSKERDDTRHEKKERRCAPCGRDEETREAREQNDVHQRIRGVDRATGGGAASVEDPVDYPHPLEEGERKCDDRCLADGGGAVVPATAHD